MRRVKQAFWLASGFVSIALLSGPSASLPPLLAAPEATHLPHGLPRGHIQKQGVVLDLRSSGRQLADEVALLRSQLQPLAVSPVPGALVLPQIQLRGLNVQVNDAEFDTLQEIPGFAPAVNFTQSETSIAAFGRNLVATYNTSANQPVVASGGNLVFQRRLLSGFSTSNDGGATWSSGFIPPVSGSVFTFGDPVVTTDRRGSFYFAGLGADAQGRTTLNVNTSRDGGRTWSDAVVVQQDDGGDKEWLAVGPDPTRKNRDNVYVTWTSFRPGDLGSELRFARSTDGGATFTTKTIFSPPLDSDPEGFVQFSNTYVDRITGDLYVPFLHFGNGDADFIRILVSRDGGETFTLLPFQVPGAPDPYSLPVVSAGEVVDCGDTGGFRLAIHAGAPAPGRFGRRTFVQVSRLITQPALVAHNRTLCLAWSNSTSSTFGDPNAGSNVLLIRSEDGGQTWQEPVQVNPAVEDNLHHVLPAIASAGGTQGVHVSYYTQHADKSIDVDLANSHDGGRTFPASRTVRITHATFELPPTNIPLAPPTGSTFLTTNYDRFLRPGYSLGEYQSLVVENGVVHVLWGGVGSSVTHPANPLDPLSGQTHGQQDVFYQRVKAP